MKSKLIISLFQTVKLSLSISVFQKNRIFVKWFHLVDDELNKLYPA